MNKKFVKNYTYDGLGFPIELSNVEMIMIEGEYHPKIDIKKISDDAIHRLVLQKNRLTGDQIKFVRTYFSKSLREFAAIVNESHMAVKKWEAFGKKPTNMDLNIEILLRLYIYDQVVIKVKNNNKEKIEFYNKFEELNNIKSHWKKAA